MKIDWTYRSDGRRLVLRADVFRPATEGRYPVILLWPYGKARVPGGLQDRMEIMAREYPTPSRAAATSTPTGGVILKSGCPTLHLRKVDSRGAGRSPGIVPQQHAQTPDIHLCVDGLRRKRGARKVGMNGISYYASNQWRTAASQPPILRKLNAAWALPSQ